MMHGFAPSMWWVWLFGLFALAGLIVLILVVVRIAVSGIKAPEKNENPPAAPGVEAKSQARQILDARYARGELTTEEYRERLTVLGEGH